MRPLTTRRPLFLAAIAVAGVTVACSIAIRRDFSAIPAGQIGFDDMCGLQEYFDTLEAKGSPPPALVSSLDLEGTSGTRAIRGGRARFRFEGEFQLKHLRRVLNENWRRLPDALAGADKVDLEVKWSEKAGVRRVVTDQEAELLIGRESFGLPYHVCLSELLYGEPLYRQRRIMWGLPLPGAAEPPPPPVKRPAPVDAGAPDAAREGARPDAAPEVHAETAPAHDAGAAEAAPVPAAAPEKKRHHRGH